MANFLPCPTGQKNTVVEIGYQLRQKPCLLYESDMKVKISESTYVYPDFSVVCGQPEFEDNAETQLLNPLPVAEVISLSSSSYDRITKADFYRGLATVQVYLLIAQNKHQVQLFTRQEHSQFFQEFISFADVIELTAIDCTLPLAEIYRDINYSDA